MFNNRINLANKFFAKKLGIKPLNLSTWKTCSQNDVAQLVPAKYSIEINKARNLDTQIIGLAHEYIHVKQAIEGRLKQINGKYYWNGKICNLEYNKQPWEIEARSLQFSWFQDFNKSLK